MRRPFTSLHLIVTERVRENIPAMKHHRPEWFRNKNKSDRYEEMSDSQRSSPLVGYGGTADEL